MKTLLVVDDDSGARESLRAVFDREYRVLVAPGADEALVLLEKSGVDLILLDVIMPGKDGLTLLRELGESMPEIPVLMISASSSVRPVVESMKSGAVDFITKPFDVAELRKLVERTLEHRQLQNRLLAMESDLSRLFPAEGLVGSSGIFQQTLSEAQRAARSDATVMIHGESGTGKEMIARQIHAWSSRREEPFVAVHCGAIPEPLLESELFGHEKGAFTNADRQKPGRFELAGSGTLFFDEVGEMSLAAQVKLLRVLQEKEYMRLGGSRVLRSQARILAASNRDLAAEVQRGRFREDLYYRLNVVPIRVPSLHERPGDIPLLLRFFLHHFREQLRAETAGFSPEAEAALCAYDWPGNIRELRNVVERMLVLHGDQREVGAELLPPEFRGPDALTGLSALRLQDNLSASVDQIERELLIQALRRCDGVQTRAARMLGTTRRILKYKMDKHAIRLPLEEEET